MKLTNNGNELEKCKTLEDLNEELLALKLRMAFQAEFEEELAEIERTEPDAELLKIMEHAEPRIRRMFAREMRREQVKHFVFEFMPKLSRALATVLLVFFLGLSAAVATMEPVRVGVVDFIENIETKFTRFDIEDDDAVIPPEWKGEYYPTYIPNKLELSWVKKYEICYGKNQDLFYYEYDEALDTNADTENAFDRLVLINGKQGIISEKNGWIKVAWKLDAKYFVVVGRYSEEEMLKIARGVKEIN